MNVSLLRISIDTLQSRFQLLEAISVVKVSRKISKFPMFFPPATDSCPCYRFKLVHRIRANFSPTRPENV